MENVLNLEEWESEWAVNMDFVQNWRNFAKVINFTKPLKFKFYKTIKIQILQNR